MGRSLGAKRVRPGSSRRIWGTQGSCSTGVAGCLSAFRGFREAWR